ncbi:MAG: cobalt chelatase [Lautropia sp.]
MAVVPRPASGAHAAARLQQRIEELGGATIRAISGDARLHFRARRLHRDDTALPLFGPHLQPSLDEDDLDSHRGAADAMALRVVHSDAALHRALCPSDATARWVFELMEQCRVERLAPPEMPGVARNLRHRFEAWSIAFHRSGLAETSRGILLYTVAQIARSRIFAEPVFHATEDLIEVTRAAITPKLGHFLGGMRRHRFDQRGFAVHARALGERVSQMIRDEAARAGTDGEPDDEASSEASVGGFTLLVDFDAEVGDGIASVESADSAVLGAAPDGYRVFTRAYDRELRASSLLRPAQATEYRERLDALIAARGHHVGRLARRLQWLFAVPSRDGWEDGREEGRVDGRRLPQLVVSPTERRLFRLERDAPVADCALAFLIDCSGSMKQHIDHVATLVDVFSRALDEAGIANEVLGFTTGAWQGGRAARDWRRAGSPAHPGRLNEVDHLVFKDADTPWRRARRDIAALFRADVFREGVDGEAIDWAVSRLSAIDARRHLLLVVSDGCPMDGATALANDDHYLDHHLRSVCARHARERRVDVLGVGVGLDLSPFYEHCAALDLSHGVDAAVIGDVLALIEGRRRR